MAMDGNLAFFECIKLEVAGERARVVESGPFPASEATRIIAREILQDRHRGGPGIEAVRFIDQSGDEICRYTLQDLLLENIPAGHPIENGEKAFVDGILRENCPYLIGTKEQEAWLLGFDTAPSNDGGSKA